ncbi:MAG: glycosyltransferase [Nitrospirota bacterium]|nr:MAG: glycosyltransferase [Nitrospirota bacterium]
MKKTETEKNSVILREEVKNQIKEIDTADILIGIPSYNNARTIGHVVSAVQAGLAKYFPDKKAVIVNSDGGSTDDTKGIVEETTLDNLSSILLSHRVLSYHKIVTPYQGIPGKGSAFRTIFEIAEAVGAKACAVVDSDLRSITPEWVDLLISPVLNNEYDYVAPFYRRHKYDGTITNMIVYPLTSTLYGKKIRQPIGGDFGFSGRLASFYLTKDVWDTDVARYGIDIWMTTTAIVYDFKICQSFLGAKIHDAKDPGSDLSDMLNQVGSSIFTLMSEHQKKWKDVRSFEEVPTFGFKYAVGLEPIRVNTDAMIEKFSLGVGQLTEIWESFLPKGVMWFLTSAAEKGSKGFTFPDEIWVEIIYNFGLAFHEKIMHHDHIIKSLTPLYLGKVASFVLETWEMESDEVEDRLDSLCRAFMDFKEYIIERWE